MKQFFKRLFSRQKPIVVVSGLPRSGTSMMMKMLEAGGLPPFIDNIRTADDDNPNGYYEFERVKALDKGDVAWLSESQGHVVKIISALLKYLPSNHRYQIIFMQRTIDEILASQKKMLIRRGEATNKISDEQLKTLYEKHLLDVKSWLDSHENCSVIYVNYNFLLENPQSSISKIKQFLGGKLNENRMVGIIDPNLYRQRK